MTLAGLCRQNSTLSSFLSGLLSVQSRNHSASRSFAVRNMSSEAWQSKKALRKSTSQKLKNLDERGMHDQSTQIIDSVLESDFFKRSTHTGIYLTCKKLREVDTSRLLDALLAEQSTGRRCYAPSVEDKNSNMNFLHVDSLDAVQEMPPYGIKEPKHTYENGSPREDVLMMDAPLDLLIMTGQAFDREGGRLGRGGGYYDKFIARCILHAKQHSRDPPLLVALAFREQVADEPVPKTENDMDMDVLVLPGETIGCSERGKAAVET